VAHETASTRATLTEHVTSLDAGSLGRLRMLTSGFVARGADPWTARERAYAIVDREVLGQASVIAYGHVYVVAALLILALIPLLILVRTTKGSAGAEMVLE
jgi:DHA2 family multidrug resistance protein